MIVSLRLALWSSAKYKDIDILNSNMIIMLSALPHTLSSVPSHGPIASNTSNPMSVRAALVNARVFIPRYMMLTDNTHVCIHIT